MTLVVEEIKRWDGDVALRQKDVEEMQLSGLSGREALELSLQLSLSAFVVKIDGEPLIFWGYCPISILGGSCIAWMLSTELADHYPILVGVGSKRIVGDLLDKYPHVIVNVDPEYTKSVAWLKWLGFQELGYDGPYLQMRKSRWVI